jgi:FtsH-binding integral membrane protein
MLDQDHVFQRTTLEGTEISAHLYNFIIGLTLLWGFAVNYYMVNNVPIQWILSIGYWPLLIGYMVSVFIGVMLYSGSSNPVVSFIGYNFIVVPMGLVITPFIYQFEGALIQEAIMMTGGITGSMMILATLYPNFFISIGRTLFLVLLLTEISELVSVFIFHKQHSAFDWIFVVIFSGYIGYDWARANSIPKTVDNAIDSAAAIYVDMINLFIRILSILGKRD